MSARQVRIPRAAARAIRPTLAPEPGARFVENRAGWTRARRLFLTFSVVLAAVYLGLIAAALAETPGLRTDPGALAILTVVAALCVAAGASVTVARAPRGVWWTGDGLVVRERFAGSRRDPKDIEARVARRYDAGWFAEAPTEIVELVPRAGRRATYLVDEGLFSRRSN